MDNQNKEYILDLKKADRDAQNDSYQFKKDMENISINRQKVENDHTQKMTEINHSHEQEMLKIKGELQDKNNDFTLKMTELKNKADDKKGERDHELNMLKEKNMEQVRQHELDMAEIKKIKKRNWIDNLKKKKNL